MLKYTMVAERMIYMSVKNVVVIKLPHTQTKVLLPLLLDVVVVG
nr:MAG TPA: hypothetical protein [Caudoviricetes sp.]